MNFFKINLYSFVYRNRTGLFLMLFFYFYIFYEAYLASYGSLDMQVTEDFLLGIVTFLWWCGLTLIIYSLNAKREKLGKILLGIVISYFLIAAGFLAYIAWSELSRQEYGYFYTYFKAFWNQVFVIFPVLTAMPFLSVKLFFPNARINMSSYSLDPTEMFGLAILATGIIKI